MLVGEQKEKTVKISLTDYNSEKYAFRRLNTIEEALPYKVKPTITWLNICGLHDSEVISKIGKHFNIHPLILEDILNTEQRPKFELFNDYLVVILKSISYNKSIQEIELEQVSFILSDSTLISFQERESEVFDPVRERIENGLGRTRFNQADDLLYALMDILVDHYFLVLENIQERLEELEETIAEKIDQAQLQDIHRLNKQLIFLRKAVWPLRDVLHGITRDAHPFIDDNTLPFISDLHDHSIQVIEMIDTLREVVTGLMNAYLSISSNRLNEVMKMLTIIATIFIPLSFIVGIYGMNFEFMPELKMRYGYFVIWGIIISIFSGMVLYFRRKRWL